MKNRIVLGVLASSCFLTSAFGDPAAAPDGGAVNAAIDKGAAWLLGQMKSPRKLQYKWMPDRAAPEFYEEFVLYTLAHAGIGTDNPVFAGLLDKVLKKKLEKNYHVACQAMALEAIDRKTYQRRIAQCAEFLVNNQCEIGGWSYGEEIPMPVYTFPVVRKKTITMTGGSKRPPEEVAKAAEQERKQTAVVARVPVARRRWGKPDPYPDNSNTQIAILGLRSCLMSGILIPEDTLPRADKYLRDGIQGEGWGYRKPEGGAWGSMTCGAISSLAICDFYIPGRDAKTDGDIQKGVKWLAGRWTWDKCPDQPRGEWQYYYFYGVERCGMLLNDENLAGHAWYNEGAQYLLSHQRGDGSWEGGNSDSIVDTCFAILFLKRATQPLRKIFTEGAK